MAASINKMTIRTTKSHTTPSKLRSAGIFRNLIAICFLVSVALAYRSNRESGDPCSCKAYGCEARSFTLTTAKDNGKFNTSTIEVRYHPRRTHVHYWSKNNHKFEKVRSYAKNEWFTITKMLDHDKANNCILVQIHGMRNRWIYYLEHDAMDFIELLKEDNPEKRVNVNLKNLSLGRVEGLPCKCPIGQEYAKDWDKASRKTDNGFTKAIHQGKKCKLNICGGSGRVFPTQEELKRGDVANGVYGFRVKLQKDGMLSKKLTPNNFSDFFDHVSVCVYLKECPFCHGTGRTDKFKNKETREESSMELRKWVTLGSCNTDKKCTSCDGKGFFNKVHYITIPNWGSDLQAHITSINCFQEFQSYTGVTQGSVVVRLQRVPGAKKRSVFDGPAADRALGLDGEEVTGREGKQLLKFLNDHAGNYAEGRPTYITDSTLYDEFVAKITADWDLNKLPHPDQPALLRQSNSNVQRLDQNQSNANSEMNDAGDQIPGLEGTSPQCRRLADILASSHEAAPSA